MAEVITKKKKSKDVEKIDIKKVSKKKDKDAGTPSKRSASASKERKEKDQESVSPVIQASTDFEAGVIFNRWKDLQYFSTISKKKTLSLNMNNVPIIFLSPSPIKKLTIYNPIIFLNAQIR